MVMLSRVGSLYERPLAFGQTAQPPRPQAAGPPVLPMPPAHHETPQHALLHQTLGDVFRKTNRFELALAEYQRAMQANPSQAGLYRRIGQAYVHLENWPQAIAMLRNALTADPNDDNARMLLAEVYVHVWQPKEALMLYGQMLERRPNLDSVRRAKDWLTVQMLADQSTILAWYVHRLRQLRVVAQASVLIEEFYRNHYADSENGGLHRGAHPLEVMRNARIVFEPTQAIFAVANVAEFDFAQNVIRMMPELAYAAPQVLAAYTVHELEHANDGDGVTSVQEEQDGYRKLARFWQHYRGDVDEPNLDYALSLYEQGREVLNEKVAEVYRSRDPALPIHSACHGLPCGTAETPVITQPGLLPGETPSV